MGLSDGTNPFTYTHNNPINGRDPTGLWDIGGHFWLTYLTAVASGEYTPKQAHELAYYTQLPDEYGKFDAIEATKEKYLIDLRNSGADVVNSADFQNRMFMMKKPTEHQQLIITVLHGLDGRDPMPRRNVLGELIRTKELNGKPLSTWQLGFVIHSYGDSFAHTYENDSGGLTSYGPYYGHAFAGHYPDALSQNGNRSPATGGTWAPSVRGYWRSADRAAASRR